MTDRANGWIPLCKDCRLAKRKWVDIVFTPLKTYRFAKCHHPSSVYVRTDDSLVTGEEPQRGQHYCSTMRSSHGFNDCGPVGKYFEPKK